METYEFTFEGKEYKISMAGMSGDDTIEHKKPGDTNTYIITIGDVARISKRNKEAILSYTKRILNSEGIDIFPDMIKDVKYINGAEQENFSYFYDMYIGNSKLGKALDRMVVDAVLIEEEKMSLGVFGDSGEFFKPISIRTAITEKNEDGTYTLQCTAFDGAGDAISFRLMNTGEVNTTGTFTITPGNNTNSEDGRITYTVLASSELSMPALGIVKI